MFHKFKKKTLFTPGPLSTSYKTKKSTLIDLGSRDVEFIKINKLLSAELLKIGKAKDYLCIPLQGSGTFGLESILSTLLNKKSNILIISNGIYGDRLVKICRKIKKKFHLIKFNENKSFSKVKIERHIKKNKSITHIGLVHCETSSGILNPLEEMALLSKKYKKKLIVDAMSSFGGININIQKNNLEALVSSANKCLEGIPGFCFCIVKKKSLSKCKENSSSLALDLYGQWQGFLKNNQWRFTPPTHSIIALFSAIEQLKKEGGVNKRNKRYKKNYLTLVKGMEKLGFDTYLKANLRSPIIVSFKFLKDTKFNFISFYKELSNLGFLIYPGTTTKEKTFRIGCIGNINSKNINLLLKAIQKTLLKMKIRYL